MCIRDRSFPWPLQLPGPPSGTRFRTLSSQPPDVGLVAQVKVRNDVPHGVTTVVVLLHRLLLLQGIGPHVSGDLVLGAGRFRRIHECVILAKDGITQKMKPGTPISSVTEP